jgi:hypothetical protein
VSDKCSGDCPYTSKYAAAGRKLTFRGRSGDYAGPVSGWDRGRVSARRADPRILLV